jgi:hypothetical protein
MWVRPFSCDRSRIDEAEAEYLAELLAWKMLLLYMISQGILEV